MFGLIIFALKLVIAAIFGALLSYSPKKNLIEEEIIRSSLLCLFGAVITGILVQLNIENNFSAGLGIIAVLFTIISLTQNNAFSKRIIWIFSGLVGVIIGLGFIFKAIVLLFLLYYIVWYEKSILIYLNESVKQSEDESFKNVSG
tara:strand:- start:535 stop:969 length:435 start_codon:yes stop_codon:yes gene_type:complete